MLKIKLKLINHSYDVTIFQSPQFLQQKGYKAVYRTTLSGNNHRDCLDHAFRLFNVADLMPPDYEGTYIRTGDIILIDDGWQGKHYYQLQTGGWTKISRILVR
ncbi:YodL domain-containing protein [Bacillus sp. CGMCC 1.16607]|uniref:YodL domain-containing protein n=1 Tax=Bacillus sp. CGMCC 1.16607 TaxID=3351842 RepID=UPI00362C7EB6